MLCSVVGQIYYVSCFTSSLGCTPTIYPLDVIFLISRSIQDPLVTSRTYCGVCHARRISFGGVGDRGLMACSAFRDYLVLQWDYHWRLWCSISNFPCDGLCEIPWFPDYFHSPFISFSWPPLKYDVDIPNTCADRF